MGRFCELAMVAASVLALVSPSEAILSQSQVERALTIESMY
jgi:hypothetical protein